MILLEAEGLTKSYGDVAAIKRVSFQLESGTAIGVIGESGSGKSTLARLLVGLERPDDGQIRLADEVLVEPRTLAQRRRMQLIFQDSLAALNPKLTIAQSIEDYLFVHAVGDRAFRRKRVLQIIEEVHLSASLIHRRPAAISGGQRQRACIARALVLSPDVLVADEPTSALDASVQGQVLNVLIEEKRRGLALVVISHDIDVISCIADKVLVMLEGEVVEAGSRDKVLKCPEHHYTRRLIATHDGLQSGDWA